MNKLNQYVTYKALNYYIEILKSSIVPSSSATVFKHLQFFCYDRNVTERVNI